ncbi:MAG TPA: hypothetical protein VJJ52_05420 [Candidatus Nanoarchaeia archaeon]|nr:hypothetical protein [Candidatus Nanoarchaeia archaeon]
MIRRNLEELSGGALDHVTKWNLQPGEIAKILRKLQPGEYYERPFDVRFNPKCTNGLTKYIDALKNEGLDIGEESSQFGYEMPSPATTRGKVSGIRYLHIYRRYK